MENRPDNYEELRAYKNRAWQAEARIKTQQKIIRVLLVFLLIIALQGAIYPVTLRVLGLRETYVLVTGRNSFSTSFSNWLRRLPNGWRVANWLGQNREYRVIFSERQNGNVEFAVLYRNRLGFWRVWERSNEVWLESGGLEFHWASLHYWNHWDGWQTWPEVAWEIHLFYFNTNAASLISIDEYLLPPNVTMSLRQQDNRYLLHFITYGRHGISLFDIEPLLTGFVAEP